MQYNKYISLFGPTSFVDQNCEQTCKLCVVKKILYNDKTKQ